MYQKHRVAKHILLSLLTVLTALFQNVFAPAAGGFPVAYFLIALIGAVAMFEPELTAVAYGALAGVLWDVASPLPDGTVTLYFVAYACAGSLLAHYLFRQTVLTSAVLTAGGSLLYAALLLLVGVPPKSADALGGVFLQSFLPCFLLTLPLAPAYYFAVRALEKKCGAKLGPVI